MNLCTNEPMFQSTYVPMNLYTNVSESIENAFFPRILVDEGNKPTRGSELLHPDNNSRARLVLTVPRPTRLL